MSSTQSKTEAFLQYLFSNKKAISIWDFRIKCNERETEPELVFNYLKDKRLISTNKCETILFRV